jgi:hypothetical protein
LKAIKASPNEHRHHYQHTNNAAPIASSVGPSIIVSNIANIEGSQ